MNRPEVVNGMMAAAFIRANSPCEVDGDNSSSLRSHTCSEQAARFHTLISLRDCIADQTFSARNRQLVTDDRRSFTHLCGAVRCELTSAFSVHSVANARTEVKGICFPAAACICLPCRRQANPEFGANFSKNNSDVASLASVNKEAAQ